MNADMLIVRKPEGKNLCKVFTGFKTMKIYLKNRECCCPYLKPLPLTVPFSFLSFVLLQAPMGRETVAALLSPTLEILVLPSLVIREAAIPELLATYKLHCP
jgi:hypothetical protein